MVIKVKTVILGIFLAICGIVNVSAIRLLNNTPREIRVSLWSGDMSGGMIYYTLASGQEKRFGSDNLLSISLTDAGGMRQNVEVDLRTVLGDAWKDDRVRLEIVEVGHGIQLKRFLIHLKFNPTIVSKEREDVSEDEASLQRI